MSKHAKIERSQKMFLQALKKKYSEDPDKSVWTKTQKEIQCLNHHPTLIPELRQRKQDDRK